VAALRPDSRGTEDEEPDDAADRLVVRVEPLTRDEAAFFAPARLSDEGRDPSRFSASALTTLHARSEGVPRRLLRLAREVLDAADREGRAAIGPAEVAALDRDRIAWLGV
jgi:type II secretory pathway predicted ATPase ExeA